VNISEIHCVQIITQLTYKDNKYLIDDMDGEVLIFTDKNPKDIAEFSNNLDTLFVYLDDTEWIDISNSDIGQEITEWYEENKHTLI